MAGASEPSSSPRLASVSKLFGHIVRSAYYAHIWASFCLCRVRTDVCKLGPETPTCCIVWRLYAAQLLLVAVKPLLLRRLSQLSRVKPIEV